ncbi:MAG: crotonase/enoyl-CoA hydratase family protein [Solirubrobacterales bacterium]|nr:crotonase/enoyl-CoA hydratase family protein [Solirubrobacterales bacterium]
MEEDRVKITVENHVAEVALVRSDKHNALDGDMFEGIVAAAERLAGESGLRAVVLHGEGPSFCSGIDVGWLAGEAQNFAAEAMKRDDFGANLFQRVSTAWIEVPVPVVAAIHGNCFGGGLQIALGADIRMTSADAKWSIREVHWGLVPDMGITASLPRLMPIDKAKELTYTGRLVSGEEAAAYGLATRVEADPLEAARALAAEIAGRSPHAVRSVKALFDTTWSSQDKSALELESELQMKLIGSPNQMAAVMAGVTKEPPEFIDP